MIRTWIVTKVTLVGKSQGSGPRPNPMAHRSLYSPLAANPTGSNPAGLTTVLTGAHIAFRSFVPALLINIATLLNNKTEYNNYIFRGSPLYTYTYRINSKCGRFDIRFRQRKFSQFI